MVDLRLIRVLVAVAREGSMTSAARDLCLTQSAVSQAVRQLEDQLGTVLVDRERRPMMLTPAGTILAQRGRALLHEAHSLFTTIREMGGAAPQDVRIGLMDSFAATAGSGLIQALGSAAVRLSVSSGLSYDLGESFAARKLDMLVTSDAMASTRSLERKLILQEPFILLLPVGKSSLANGPLCRIARELAFVRFNQGSHIAAEIERFIERAGLTAPRRLEIDSAENLTAMVASNAAWAITTPLCLLQARHWADAVVSAPLPPVAPTRSIHLLAREGEYGALPDRIAQVAREQFRDRWTPVLRQLIPWIEPVWRVDGLVLDHHASSRGTGSAMSSGIALPVSQTREDASKLRGTGKSRPTAVGRTGRHGIEAG